MATRFQRLLERERTRLAQELHDNLTQKLTVVSLELSLLDGNLSSEQELSRARISGKIKEIGLLINDMIHSLRRIKAELRPKVLDEFGLVAALEWESEVFSKRRRIECRFHAEPEDMEVPSHLSTELFRMFQEILANVAVHAKAHRVQVDLKQERSWLILQAKDDGLGITPEQMASSKSVGLLELRERTAALGGELRIHGTPGAGTTVVIRVPRHRPNP